MNDLTLDNNVPLMGGGGRQRITRCSIPFQHCCLQHIHKEIVEISKRLMLNIEEKKKKKAMVSNYL